MDSEARLLLHPSEYPLPFNSEVIEVEDSWVRLRSTEFYPTGGGQPNDTGLLIFEGNEVSVTDVKGRNEVMHLVDGIIPSVGTMVEGIIDSGDWEERSNVAREDALAEFSWDRSVESLHGLCQEVISN